MNFFEKNSKFSRKFVKKNLCRSSFGRSGSGSRELRAVKIPASCDAWRPPKRRKNDSGFFFFRKSVFRMFSWMLEGIDNFRRQNQFSREMLLQIHLYILRSVRPKIAKKRFVLRKPGLCEPYQRAPNSMTMVFVGGGVGHLRVILT